MRQHAEFKRRRVAELLGRVADFARRLWEPIERRLGAIERRLLPSCRVLIAIGMPMFLFGWANVPAWKLIGWIGGSGLATTELPFGDLDDVAVDSKGRIYVADGFHSRVQRYSPDGEFERGWYVPTSGVFALRTAANDEVHVATARANKLLKYNSDGDLLSGQYRLKEDYYQEYESETETTGPYAVRGGLLPHVVDTRTGGTVITRPWHTGLIAPFFPAVLYSVIGFALVGVGELKRRRERSR